MPRDLHIYESSEKLALHYVACCMHLWHSLGMAYPVNALSMCVQPAAKALVHELLRVVVQACQTW